MGPKSKDIGTTVSNAEFVEIENEYDEIQDISRKPRDLPPSAITKKTQDITYYNPSPKASNSDANHVVSQSDKTMAKVGLSKSTQPTSEDKLNFVQVDGFRGKWSFFAFQCPKSYDDVGEFWRFIDDRSIQNIVLLEDVSSKVRIDVADYGDYYM
ncbi:hypothetical protein CAPTEDRAFT_188325 [Capitella teleta]|uniref:Tyrosine-protein phosphatase domain-containing protein n=1 Tax=Capitella teleta TaxID=283909 RepID=R7VIN4_CAPTE|nr:hypothetical protein CAPTEDRAFT_188325 [Capitella teleta]|eukprot:ELU18489.1 hypothetical protein CAPTEDRAFT_188325 [Capitella teleta]